MLATHKLSIKRADKTICDQLDVVFNPGECWAILGANGSGKTTLLHTLAGLFQADSGEVLLEQSPLQHYQGKQRAQHIGVLFQDQYKGLPATVMENTLIGRHPYLQAWQWETAQDHLLAKQALNEVDMIKLSQRNIQSLSGGEMQRAAIASLRCQQPKIWLLDEPSNHLDMHHQISILKLFSEQALQQQQLVCMSLHDLNLAQRFCSHALLLQANGQTEFGLIDEVLSVESLQQAYQHPINIIEHNQQRIFLPQ